MARPYVVPKEEFPVFRRALAEYVQQAGNRSDAKSVDRAIACIRHIALTEVLPIHLIPEAIHALQACEIGSGGLLDKLEAAGERLPVKPPTDVRDCDQRTPVAGRSS